MISNVALRSSYELTSGGGTDAFHVNRAQTGWRLVGAGNQTPQELGYAEAILIAILSPLILVLLVLVVLAGFLFWLTLLATSPFRRQRQMEDNPLA